MECVAVATLIRHLEEGCMSTSSVDQINRKLVESASKELSQYICKLGSGLTLLEDFLNASQYVVKHNKSCFKVLKDAGFLEMISDIFEKILTRLTRDGFSDGLQTVVEIAIETANVLADVNPSAKSSVFLSICPYFLDLMLHGLLSFQTRMEVLKATNQLLEQCPVQTKETFLHNRDVSDRMHSLVDFIRTVGDYEFQVGLVECLMRLFPRKARSECAALFITDNKMREEFLSIRDKEFETDCRLFLNAVNGRSKNPNKGVFSLPCLSAYVGSKQLRKPSDSGYDEFWVDFNIGSERLTLFCEQDSLLSQSSCMEEDLWETVAIYKTDVQKCTCNDTGQLIILEICLKSPVCQIYPSQHHDVSDNKITIQFMQDLESHITHAVAHTFNFAEKRNKVSTVEKPLQISIREVQETDSQNQQDVEAPKQREKIESGSLHGSQESTTRRRKVSVPSIPMKNPIPTPLSTPVKSSSSIEQTHSVRTAKAEVPMNGRQPKVSVSMTKLGAADQANTKLPEPVNTSTFNPLSKTSEKEKECDRDFKAPTTPIMRNTRSKGKVKTPVVHLIHPSKKTKRDQEKKTKGKEKKKKALGECGSDNVIPDSVPFNGEAEVHKETASELIKEQPEFCSGELVSICKNEADLVRTKSKDNDEDDHNPDASEYSDTVHDSNHSSIEVDQFHGIREKGSTKAIKEYRKSVSSDKVDSTNDFGFSALTNDSEFDSIPDSLEGQDSSEQPTCKQNEDGIDKHHVQITKQNKIAEEESKTSKGCLEDKGEEPKMKKNEREKNSLRSGTKENSKNKKRNLPKASFVAADASLQELCKLDEKENVPEKKGVDSLDLTKKAKKNKNVIKMDSLLKDKKNMQTKIDNFYSLCEPDGDFKDSCETVCNTSKQKDLKTMKSNKYSKLTKKLTDMNCTLKDKNNDAKNVSDQNFENKNAGSSKRQLRQRSNCLNNTDDDSSSSQSKDEAVDEVEQTSDVEKENHRTDAFSGREQQPSTKEKSKMPFHMAIENVNKKTGIVVKEIQKKRLKSVEEKIAQSCKKDKKEEKVNYSNVNGKEPLRQVKEEIIDSPPPNDRTCKINKDMSDADSISSDCLCIESDDSYNIRRYKMDQVEKKRSTRKSRKSTVKKDSQQFDNKSLRKGSKQLQKEVLPTRKDENIKTGPSSTESLVDDRSEISSINGSDIKEEVPNKEDLMQIDKKNRDHHRVAKHWQRNEKTETAQTHNGNLSLSVHEKFEFMECDGRYKNISQCNVKKSVTEQRGKNMVFQMSYSRSLNNFRQKIKENSAYGIKTEPVGYDPYDFDSQCETVSTTSKNLNHESKSRKTTSGQKSNNKKKENTKAKKSKQKSDSESIPNFDEQVDKSENQEVDMSDINVTEKSFSENSKKAKKRNKERNKTTMIQDKRTKKWYRKTVAGENNSEDDKVLNSSRVFDKTTDMDQYTDKNNSAMDISSSSSEEKYTTNSFNKILKDIQKQRIKQEFESDKQASPSRAHDAIFNAGPSLSFDDITQTPCVVSSLSSTPKVGSVRKKVYTPLNISVIQTPRSCQTLHDAENLDKLDIEHQNPRQKKRGARRRRKSVTYKEDSESEDENKKVPQDSDYVKAQETMSNFDESFSLVAKSEKSWILERKKTPCRRKTPKTYKKKGNKERNLFSSQTELTDCDDQSEVDSPGQMKMKSSAVTPMSKTKRRSHDFEDDLMISSFTPMRLTKKTKNSDDYNIEEIQTQENLTVSLNMSPEDNDDELSDIEMISLSGLQCKTPEVAAEEQEENHGSLSKMFQQSRISLLGDSGFASGPSSEVRPRVSELKRKFPDVELDLHQDAPVYDESEEEMERSILAPKKLFKFDPSAMLPEISSPVGTSTYSDLTQDDGYQGNFGISTFISTFGADIQKQFQTKKHKIDQFIKQSQRETQKHLNNVMIEQHQIKSNITDDYHGKMMIELLALEKDLGQLRDAEQKAEDFFKCQKAVLHENYESQKTRLKKMKALEHGYMDKSKKMQKFSQEQQRTMLDKMRIEMKTLQRKLMAEHQRQEYENIRRGLQTLF